jgi:hypothetical protein
MLKDSRYTEVKNSLEDLNLNTVCEEGTYFFKIKMLKKNSEKNEKRNTSISLTKHIMFLLLLLLLLLLLSWLLKHNVLTSENAGRVEREQ